MFALERCILVEHQVSLQRVYGTKRLRKVSCALRGPR